MTTTTNTRQLVLTRPSDDYFGDGNALLLCLDAEERLLHHFFLTQEGISVSPIAMWACVIFATGMGASTLVRIQTHQVPETAATRALRQTAHLHGLRFIEANPSEFTHLHRYL